MKILISLFCFITACSAMQLQSESPSFSTAEKMFEESGSTAVVVLQHGKTLLSWGDVSKPLHVHSIRKSILNALYGIHSQKINLNSTLQDLNIDDNEPKLTQIEKQATVQHLLQSRSGVYHAAAYETDAMKKERPERGSHAPGTFWYYNNWDFNTLSTIFKQHTGVDVFEAFENDLSVPLGMEDFKIESNTQWRYEPTSIHPAYKFELSARDLARFGQLFLNEGKWQGKEIIPESWIKESLKPYSKAKPGVSYGYLWWVADGNIQFGQDMGEKTYSARGFNGQIILIFPEKELVIVHLTERRVSNAVFGNMVKSILGALAQAKD